MSVNLIMVLFMTRSARDLEALEKYYFFACFGLPFLTAFIPIFIYDSVRGSVYGGDILRCWITRPWPQLRLSLFYAPVWSIFAFNLSVYMASGISILMRTRHLPPPIRTSTGGKPRALSETTTTLDHNPRRDSVFSQTSYHRPSFLSDSNSTDPHTANHHTTNNQRRFTNYSLASSSPSIVSETVTLALQSFRSRYFQKISLFLMAYLIAWIFPSIARLLGWLYAEEYDKTLFWLYVAQEVTSPLRGFINFLCYFLLSFWNSWQEKEREVEKMAGGSSGAYSGHHAMQRMSGPTSLYRP